MFDQTHEECGVYGIWQPEKCTVARTVLYGLIALQHRGEESAGIAVNEDRVIRCYKQLGLAGEVFTQGVHDSLGSGNMAVGHVRYSTSGGDTPENAQPMLVKHIKGQLALAHNGNLTNSAELREELERKGCIFHTTSDTEVISYVITGKRLVTPSIEEAVSAAMDLIEGAYSIVLMSPAKMIAARDPHGFKPLCMGRTPEGGYAFASESCAFDATGITFIRDLLPGEMVVINREGEVRSITTHCNKAPRTMCIFEYIYFSRPDSVLDGISVHEFRYEAGRLLARSFPTDADVVIGVPDSGLEAAAGYAAESGIPYRIGLIKNKYIGRSFIAPTQSEREDMVHRKLGFVSSVLSGKRVVLIDDSIVRGTTSKQIVKMVRQAGAKEVHMRISSPPFLNPCYYGTDIDSREHLIATRHTVEEIGELIGVDSLGFLPLDGAKEILEKLGGKEHSGCCAACFDGNYPTAIPVQGNKDRFE